MFQKNQFSLIILYDILFYFIHVYITPGQEETTLGDNPFLMESEKSYHFAHRLHVSKIALPSDFMHMFHVLYIYITLGQEGTKF